RYPLRLTVRRVEPNRSDGGGIGRLERDPRDADAVGEERAAIGEPTALLLVQPDPRLGEEATVSLVAHVGNGAARVEFDVGGSLNAVPAPRRILPRARELMLA